MLEYEKPLGHRRRWQSGFSYSSKRDYHVFDSLLGIGVGRSHVLATATGLKSLPPKLRETCPCSNGFWYSSKHDYHRIDSPLGIGVGHRQVLATAKGLNSLPPELCETRRCLIGLSYSSKRD